MPGNVLGGLQGFLNKDVVLSSAFKPAFFLAGLGNHFPLPMNDSHCGPSATRDMNSVSGRGFAANISYMVAMRRMLPAFH